MIHTTLTAELAAHRQDTLRHEAARWRLTHHGDRPWRRRGRRHAV